MNAMNHEDVVSNTRLGLDSAIGLLADLALASTAGVFGWYLISNFGNLVRLEGQLMRDLMSGPSTPMAGPPILVPIIIIVVLIVCVISALTIRWQYQKMVQAIKITYQKVTTCNWTASLLGFLKCLVTTVIYTIMTFTHILVTVIMTIVLFVNVLAVLVIFK